jgi:hypothetical protein
LPAFLRTEYTADLGTLAAGDAFWRVYVPVQSHICINDTVLVNMPNPYNPCFILDLELAEEYVRSRSFDREASQAVCGGSARTGGAGFVSGERPAAFSDPLSRTGEPADR